jgi:hypothetical protein
VRDEVEEKLEVEKKNSLLRPVRQWLTKNLSKMRLKIERCTTERAQLANTLSKRNELPAQIVLRNVVGAARGAVIESTQGHVLADTIYVDIFFDGRKFAAIVLGMACAIDICLHKVLLPNLRISSTC